MIADVGYGSDSVQTRYIHWKSDKSFKVEEVLCYEEKRLYREEMKSTEAYDLEPNSSISYTGSNCNDVDELVRAERDNFDYLKYYRHILIPSGSMDDLYNTSTWYREEV